MNINLLKQKKAKAVADAKAITIAAETAGGTFTAEQETQFNAFLAEAEALDKQIAQAEKLAAFERNLESAPHAAAVLTPSAAAPISGAHIIVGEDLATQRPFASFGEQLQAIVRAAAPDDRWVDPRLNAGPSGASERVPSDGGFLVQQDFASDILGRMYEQGEITSRVRKVPISAASNGLKANAIDESSRADGSRFGGVVAYWEGEGETPTAKKPKFRQLDLKLNKLIGLMYATDELLQDSVAFSDVATQAFADEIEFMVEAAIFEGNGVGKPKGIINSNCLVTVSKETGQAGTTLTSDNIMKMWSRCWGRSRKNAVWLINQDIEPQLFSLSQNVGTGGIPVYQPANGLADAPFSTLMGRPVIPIEHAATLGTVGDIGLYDLSQYLLIDKGNAKQDVSIHVRFIYDEQTFRIVYRVDGQPIWNTTLTPKKGSNTLSPFVVLGTRS